MSQFEKILKKALILKPDLNKERLKEAYEYVSEVNKGRYRLSGDPYVTHVLSIIEILLTLNPDEDTLIAAMLHGISGADGVDMDDVRNRFGETVFYLISAMDSLKALKSGDENSQAESLRGMFVSMAKDLRVIMIKLADVLDNMQTVGYMSAEKQKQYARQTMEIYVPIAARLGIYSLKTKLEDLAFKTLYPKHYENVKADLDEFILERENAIDYMKKELGDFLAEHNIEAKIEGRVKNLYSIYRKLKIKSQTTLNDLHDVLAMRIILLTRYNESNKETYEHLYSVLGLIHSRWTPIAHRFKDYVAVSKPNGYQSLHTAVLGLSPNSSHTTEIQLRTDKMHMEAEYGVASHWIYDGFKKISGKNKKNMYSVKALSSENESSKKYVEWINVASKIQRNIKGGKDAVEALKIDVFTDRIFVMTPEGDVKDLPKGSTPIDFAYSVHTDIGHRCQLAKVNGSVVSLDYELQNGEVVEIVPGNQIAPKSAWLAFVKSAHAKSKIRSYLRSLDKEKSFKDGKDILNKYLAKIDKPYLDDDLSIFRVVGGQRLSMRERVSLVEEVGNGAKLSANVLRDVFGAEFSMRERRARAIKKKNLRFALPKSKNLKASDDEVVIAGERGLPYRLANCCKPKVGQSITGYITRGHSITIHQRKCKHLRNASEDRIIEARWGSDKKKVKFSIKINLLSRGRVNLIRDIAEVITNMGVDILFFSDTKKVGDVVSRDVILEVSDDLQLQTIMEKLNRVRNVIDVKRSD